jgi:hypothetical protein
MFTNNPIGERTLVPVPTGDLVVTGHTVARAFGSELSFEAGGELVATA